MSNTPAIPEEIRQSIKDYSAGRSPRATVQADCIFGYSLAQKEISTLEQTIKDQDKQILSQKQEIEKHIDKFKEMLGLIEEYRKSVETTPTGNHVYNEIRQHLIETKKF